LEEVVLCANMLRNLVENKTHASNLLYSFNGTGLNYKMRPSKNTACPQETAAPHHNQRKRNYTRLLYSIRISQNGTCVIGKPAEPRTLKCISLTGLLPSYRDQKSASIDRDLPIQRIVSWRIRRQNIENWNEINLSLKTILLVPIPTSHPSEDISLETVSVWLS
jgi:hypothetical protein